MTTASHASLNDRRETQYNVGFEQTLAQSPLRRVEAKEFLFAEGDA
jgi:hypothetical protein